MRRGELSTLKLIYITVREMSC